MPQRPKRTALIIDDEPELRNLVAEVLDQNDWSVLQAQDGESGIKTAEQHFPNIILCDLLMSRGNGFQVCRSLRAMPALSQTRIVVMSGRDFESDRHEALAAGADEYITKPFQPRDLVALLDRLMPKSKAPSGAEGPAGSAASLPFRIKFWGVRGSIPTPGPTTVEYGGNTSCIEVRVGEQIIILDAGTGLRLLGRALLAEFGEQSLDLTLLLTHTHWDHIQGLPFFMPVYKPQNRLRILGYEGARRGLDNVLSSQMENPFFPIGLRELPANVRIEELKDLSFTLGQVDVRTCFAYHPGICVGYRLSCGGRALAFFPDNELRHNSPAAGAAGAGFAREENNKLVEFCRGVDVLIMDTQYDSHEYQAHAGWGHGCLDEVVSLALQAEVGQLFLFHHDPDHDDAKVRQMTEHARRLVAEKRGRLKVDAAREGLAVELPVRA